jgi:hypothetical protein
MSININQLCQTIETNIETLAKSTLKDYLTAAKADGNTIVNDLKEHLQEWATEAEEGFLNRDDVQFLIAEQGALTEMAALKEAGLAAARVDEFKDGIVSIVTGAVTGMVKV